MKWRMPPQIVDPESMQLFTRADITDVYKMVTGNLAKFRALYDYHYVMLDVIRLIDTVMGNESLDYSHDKVKKMKLIQEILNAYSKSLRDDPNFTDPSRVKEVILQVTTKWDIMKSRNEGNNFEEIKTPGQPNDTLSSNLSSDSE